MGIRHRSNQACLQGPRVVHPARRVLPLSHWNRRRRNHCHRSWHCFHHHSRHRWSPQGHPVRCSLRSQLRRQYPLGRSSKGQIWCRRTTSRSLPHLLRSSSFVGHQGHNSYGHSTATSTSPSDLALLSGTPDIWHKRLGHVPMNKLSSVANLVGGMQLTGDVSARTHDNCDSCLRDKAKRKVSRKFRTSSRILAICPTNRSPPRQPPPFQNLSGSVTDSTSDTPSRSRREALGRPSQSLGLRSIRLDSSSEESDRRQIRPLI